MSSPADGGKGSLPRPFSVSQQQLDDNYERTFGKKVVCDRCGKTLRVKPDEPSVHTCTPQESQR